MKKATGMRDFARLYAQLDASTSTKAKVQTLRAHLASATAADSAWAVYLLAGGKPRQAVPTAVLRAAACEAAGVEAWLFEECYQVVGDLAETMAHVLPHHLSPVPTQDEPDADPLEAHDGLAAWMLRGVLPLRGLDSTAQKNRLRVLWSVLRPEERFLLTKLVGGGFRVGVSKLLVQRAVAEHAGLKASEVAQRMMGYTQAAARPTAEDWQRLIGQAPGDVQLQQGQPYPFFLAQALSPGDETRLPQMMGPASDWMAEWKYDGIRAQLIRRGTHVWIWSRGEELITDRFPEVVAAAQALPVGTVLDGELLVMREGRPAPFAELQTRITRKTVSKALRTQSPVTFMAYDLLEYEGQDWRPQAQRARRRALEALLADGPFPVSALAVAGSADDLWETWRDLRAQSRSRGVEGLMLKHLAAPYGVGRRKVEGAGVLGWWKWKVEPMSVDAVLVYAQAGHGRRANLYTDYTFAVWSRTPRDGAEVQQVLQAIEHRQPPDPDGLHLVPFAKAYSGLSDEAFAQVDKIIRRSTVEKFGPVRSVVPSLVFEIGFEGLSPSPRHKSGIAVRFPRMLRWRVDKPLQEADTLQTLQNLHSGQGSVAQTG